VKLLGIALLFGTFLALPLHAQEAAAPEKPTEEETVPDVPQEVDVDPVTEDVDIAARLQQILVATEWFVDPEVEVDEGVVFLRGKVDTEQHREWAARLAGKTTDVVAVVNRIQVIEKSPWDMTPAWNELEDFSASIVRSIPLILVGSILLVGTFLATKGAVTGARAVLGRRVKSRLLRDVAARAVAVPVFLLGLYLVLKISGLTRLAMTVLGGTGIVGLIVGFAFRDIAENFLASILISIQHPFARSDLIEVAGQKGFVQSVNTRATLLMTLDGNHVQIPNSTIYKEKITNFTANPNTRLEFTVGIGYDDSISEAQSVALQIVQEHPAVVSDPEPLVLVEALGAATVNLRVYFWVDTTRYSPEKVPSAVIRQVKTAFDAAGISMPDEAREVVFPSGVPVRMLEEDAQPTRTPDRQETRKPESESLSHSAEGDLSSDADEIQEQAQKSRSPEAGTNLLEE